MLKKFVPIVDRSKALLADANNVLKASGCKLRIEVKGNSLVLRGVLRRHGVMRL